ncbi:hypothetical protein GEV33_014870 [Tenebrio molitor]|uniref:Cadherin domain-containing protein n=1 Tax=Tenebrio molitor TaxID=7067 RepID=A0A8J6LCB6_TENMO|nr:hypothetical protein GEV33_014870 [Tenebrio molitor]
MLSPAQTSPDFPLSIASHPNPTESFLPSRQPFPILGRNFLLKVKFETCRKRICTWGAVEEVKGGCGGCSRLTEYCGQAPSASLYIREVPGFSTPSHRGISHITDKTNAGSVSNSKYLPPSFRTHEKALESLSSPYPFKGGNERCTLSCSRLQQISKNRIETTNVAYPEKQRDGQGSRVVQKYFFEKLSGTISVKLCKTSFNHQNAIDRSRSVHRFDRKITVEWLPRLYIHHHRRMVQITVLDKNDSPPSFKDTPLHYSISEDLGPGQSVATVRADDPDTIGKLEYTLIRGDDGHFVLDKNTGVLSLVDSLDRETKDVYKLTVRASDGNQHTDTVLTVQITDTNDNPPAFLESAYSFDIPENAPRGSRVGQIKATDPDLDTNAHLTYTVISDWANDVFSLNPQTGVFTLTSRLDYEEVGDGVHENRTNERQVHGLFMLF